MKYLRVPDEGVFQKRVVRTKLDIPTFFIYGLWCNYISLPDPIR
jgi:hypothetical protein